MATKITTPELFNLSSNNTAATQLPVFTTSTRPTPTTSTVQVDYLVVAGGGGGGNLDGGGGGAGGYLTNYNGTPISITTSNLYTVTVGEGGVGGQKNVITSGVGGNSVFDTIISYGGGGGASDNNTGPSSNGGSGGGAAGGNNPTIGLASPPGQGYNGGNSSGNLGGGGGGASEAGNTDGQGHGGDGLSNSITGTATFYAGGGGGDYRSGGYPGGNGGGGAGSGSLPSNDGTPNTGGGGGAIGGATNYQGGSGGSGIVILRYPTSSSLNITTTGTLVYTESTDGSDTVLQFTEGSGNFGFASAGIAVGEMIFNSTTEKVEYWDGFQWNMIKDEIAGESPYNNVLYTGNGATQLITGVGFEPDLVWIKQRTGSVANHLLFDSIRGAYKQIMPNTTSSGVDRTSADKGLTSFDSNGFTVKDTNAGDYEINGPNGGTYSGNGSYVAWCWKAGGAAVPNTNGSTASQVSANAAGGFSIVKTTGTSGAITFGHGLDTAPEMIINKGITSSGWSWLVYHKDIGTGKYLKLNSTDGTTLILLVFLP